MVSVFASKFVKTLKTLSKEEMRSFGLWLNSPWCNTNKNLITLFEKLKKYYPDFEDTKLTKEKLSKKVLPNGKFSEKRINNLLSEAFLAVEQFIIFQNLKKNESLRKSILTKEWQGRNMDDWFFKEINSGIEKLENKNVKDWEEHLELFLLNRQLSHHPGQNLNRKPDSQTIIKLSEELDILYFFEKGALINEKIFRNRLLKDENHDVESEIEKWKLGVRGLNYPTIDFYYRRFSYTEENFLNEYFELKEDFISRFDQLNEKEKKTHLFSLLNDTTKLIRARKVDITSNLPLYKLGLESQVLFNKGKLSYFTYTSIVISSNAKKDFDFTSHFIETYTDKLDERIRIDAYNWAKAHISYGKEMLNKCIDILLSHNFKFRHYQISSKMLTCQVYFDLYLEDDSYQIYLYNFFDSYEKWILREKVGSDIFKKGILRFIQKCRALAKYYSDSDFQKEKIQNLLKNETNIQGTKWLSQRIDKVIELRKK